MNITDCTRPNSAPKAGPRSFEPVQFSVQDSYRPSEVIPPTRKPAAPQPSGPLTQQAEREEQIQQDWQQAREILARIAAARRLSDQRILALLADLSTQVFSLWQEVMARRRKACDEALARWSKLMFE